MDLYLSSDTVIVVMICNLVIVPCHLFSFKYYYCCAAVVGMFINVVAALVYESLIATCISLHQYGRFYFYMH